MILKSVLPWEARYMKGLREMVGNFVPSCKEPLVVVPLLDKEGLGAVD